MKSVTVQNVPQDAQLIDVREVDEYAAVHAANAVNLPMSEFVQHVDKLDQQRDIYVICQGGGRSAKVCEYLEARGIEAINVEGGTGAWQQANLPMES